MVDNQHQLIKGYRDLTDQEISSMNEVKDLAELVGGLVAELEMSDSTDKRWVALGKTHLQQGFMALVRSVAQPESF